MPKGYKHITCEQRCQIYSLNKNGFSCRRIARELGCCPSTICRELKRNSGARRGYSYKRAQRLAEQRRHAASSCPRKMTGQIWAVVDSRLSLQWSPEQISGRLRLEGVVSVSAQWIYRHVWADKKAGGTLFKHLRRRGKKRNRRGSEYSGRGHIPGRVDIEDRRAIVEEKSRVGDWEADTIVGAGHKGAVVSLVDRASKFAVLELVESKSASKVGEAIGRGLKPYEKLVHTVTSDNGKEFAYHEKISAAVDAGFFFAKPYHSWERGLNEHTNGLVRQYFPKSTNFHEIDAAALGRVENLLNQRPRKVLSYQTPAEVFNQALDGESGLEQAAGVCP